MATTKAKTHKKGKKSLQNEKLTTKAKTYNKRKNPQQKEKLHKIKSRI